ncbi:uncharacterized protein LOC123296183 [Chrysoperla carnea]|uniref:uncharacterized protein LOC123296183 n=1 Tax=Chrysoperla carnea TaxID=189513 RepID=UPI001D05FE1D|nr:uncharacterized protein LOC123296183 [Chrysoperla carnea]
MKVIEKNDTEKLSSESTAILIVNDLIERVFNKIMTQDSKINLEPKSDIPSSSDDVTERDVRLKSSTLKSDDAAVLDTSDTDSLRCSLPLEKIDDHILQELSSSGSSSDEVQSVENSSTTTTPLKSSTSSAITTPSPTTSSTPTSTCKKRLFCLYCDRIFVSSNLRQKHVERCHSANQLRRSSSRTPGHSKLSPSCMFCGQVDNVGNDLKKLLEHLIVEHSMKYHGCLDCEERFGSKESLKIHNSSVHGIENETITIEDDEKELPQVSITNNTSTEVLPLITNTISMDTEKKKKRIRKSDIDNSVIETLPPPPQNPMIEDFEETIVANVISAAEILKQKELMEKENALKLAELEKQKTSNRNTKKGSRTNSGARNNNNNSETATSSPRTTRRSTKSSASSTPVKTKSKTNKVTAVSNPDEGNLDQIKSENSLSKTETISIKVTSTSCETSSPPNYEFDENFFTCVSFNIQENLLNHLDGKLHTNNELSPMSSLHAYHQTKGSKTSETNSAYTNANGEDDDDVNNLALTALTPVTTLLTSQIGIDAYRQIEYGSKAPKHHVTRKHYVKYNFRSRKQKPSDMDISKDISKLDMWTQVAMKMRQQKIKTNLLDDEINRRTEQQVEELNRILDTRGPFQDLHEEALNSQQNDEENNSSTDEVKTVLEDILINVFDKVPSSSEGTSSAYENNPVVNLDKFISDRLKNVSNQKVLKIEDTKFDESCNRITTRSRLRNESTNERLIENETLSYFNLTRTPAASTSGTTSMSITRRTSIDMKTTTESLYKLGLDVKQMNKFLSENDHEIIVSSSVELSGEWARPRIYICGACGVKITNLKLLEDHKQFIHPHVWCAHYEFVGNQSEFYPHLNIPGLGRILENEKKEIIRNWEKSSARQCSKCQKECNTLGDLHRHMLECGGDWSWMLAKKKCKYRPFGARSRRRRVMELKRKLRVRLEGGSSSTGENTTRSVVERRRNRSKLEGPRPPRPSDADTIQRMLANLPPKRATRKIMSLKEQGLRKPNRLNPNKTNVNSNRTKQLLKSPKTNNKNETIKAANQKMKQALQRNLRSRNQLNNVKNETASTVERKVSPRTTRRSASNSPKNEKQTPDNTNIVNNNRKTKVQKVLASKIIDSNTALGPKSKIFSRKKTRFGETVVTRLRNKILLAQKYINSDNTVRLTRSRGLHVAKQQIDEEIIKDNPDSNQKKKSTNKNDNKTTVEESEDDVPKTKRRLRSLKFLTKTLRSQKKINEVSENLQNTPSTSPARRSNRMRILSRIQRKLPSFNRRNKDKNEGQKNEKDNSPTEENSTKPSSDENIDKTSEDKTNENVEAFKTVEETRKDENFDQPPVLEKITAPTKPKSNIDYCIESVVANITGQVTYKEYPRSTTVSSMEEPKKSSFSLKTFTQNMRNIGKKITNNSKNEPLNLAADAPEVSENDAAAEKIQLGKRKRVISTQTDITPSLPEEEQPPLLFPQIPIPPPLPLVPPVSALPVPIIPPVTTATIHDTISDTIEEVIAKYTVESSSDTEDDLLTKSNKKLKVNTNGIGSEKCDTIPKNLSNQNFPMPILEAVGPPNDLKRGDSIVTIPILLPVVSHVIISTGTQINSNLLEKIMDTSINNFQLNNIVPNDKTNPLLNTLSPGAGKNSEKILDSDLSGKSPVGNKEYHNYVIETPMQKLIQNGLYPVLPPNSIPNVAFDNLQISETSGENSTQNSSTSEDTTKKDNKNKSKGLKKPIKKLNDCINMLKQKLMSSSSTENSDTNPRGDILKIPTPKFNKPPIFSDPIPKKITEAPFPTTPVKKPVDISQGLDFSLPKNVPEDDQTSPIDLSCSTTSKKLFVDAPIANEVEHIIETKSIQKPPTKPKGSINFSDLPRQMELLANQNERREAERNQQQEIVSEKLITHHHPIILNVPEVVESASISNIELQKNQNEIVDVENRTKDGSEQSLVNITSLPPSSLQRLIPPSNDLVTKTLLSLNNTSIEKNSEFGSNDNIAKIPIDLSSHPIQETSSHVLDVQNLINNQMTENDNKRGGRKRGTNRRIGAVRTRPIRKCNSNEEEPEVALIPRPNEDIGSDTSFEDVPLIKLVQTQDSSEDIPQNLVKVTPLAPVVDNLTEIINQVAKNTINKPKDNLTEIINQVAENTINKDDSKKRIEIIPPPIIEIEKPKEVIESDLPKKLSETSQSKEQISNLMKVRKKPGRKPKSVFEPLDKTPEIPKPEQTVITEQTVIANVVIHHSTPEIKTPDMCGGNSSCITDDFDLENALPLFTVGKISPLQVSVQDPKTLMVDTIKSQLEVTTPSTSGIDTTKRPRLKPGRKPKKLLEQIENKSENVSNIVQNESILNKTESTNISSDSIPPQIIDGKPSDSLDISSNIPKTDISTENSNALTQVKKPGRKPRKQVEQIQTPVPVIENNQINQMTESQMKEVQSENVPETSATLRESLADELTVESTEIDKIESVENITSSQSKKPGRKSKKGLDENKSESSSNQLENISEPSITLQSSTINETPVENTETERSETSNISDDILKEPENIPRTKDQKSNEIDSSQISETDIPEKITENLTAANSLQIKKPGRKSKKLDENKSENLNFSNDALKEPEIVLNTQDQNNSFQIIETEISKELTIENSGRKKPGRKPKKVLEEKSQSANVSNDILKESEGVLNTEDQESVQNVSSEITKLDISKELPTEITVTKDSSQLKKPGRKPKKIVDDNQLETSDVSSEILIEPKNNFNIEDQNSSQNDSSQIIESEISGKEIQTASKEFITETSTGKKKSGRKPKKVFEEKSESSNSSNDFLKEPENVLNLEDQNTINVSSEITKSDGSNELPAENAITTICSQSKKPGRKPKKIVDENKMEATDVSSDILKISEKVLNTQDQNSTQIDSQIIDVSKELLAETSTVKNSSHSKKPGRKPKNISDELETKDVTSDILKESENVLNIEDQNSSRIDSSQKMESNISKELLTETSPENNSSQYKKPGRKHKKPVEESESPKDGDNLTDVLEKSQSVLKIEHQNSIQNDPSEITNSDISKGLTIETSITKNSSQSKKPGRKSKKIVEEDKSDNLNISGTISKEPESIFNIEDQNCTQNDSSRIMESDITNKLTSESPTATKKKLGRKQKKVFEEISQSFNTSNDNLNEPESVTHTEDKKSIKNVSSEIIESDISKELTNENTSNVPDKLQNLPENLNISTRNEISNHENVSVPFEVNTSVFKNTETGINESTENITINDSSQFKRPGRKPKKSLKQPEKDDTSHDKLFDSEINNIPNIEEEELLKNVLNKKPGRRSRKLTVDSLEEKSESLGENVQETVITPELEQISIDIKSMPVRKSGRRSKNSSLERCQKVEKADIDVQNILDNVPVIETPQLSDENVQEIVKTAEIEQISNEFKSTLVRKSGRRSKNSSLERPQKIENSDIDIHNILDIDPTIESLQLKKTNRKSKKSLEQSENKFESSIENSKETTNEFVKPNLEQNKSVEQIIENKISSDNQPKIVENKPESSKTIENILENSLEQNENNQNSIERKISENSNDLSDNSYQGKNSGRKFRKIILEQTETIDNEISEDSNTSKCSTYSRKSGRKSKRIFEHVENVTEFENIEDNEFYHNSRRKSGRISKSSLEQPHISDLSNINNSNLVFNDSLIPQVHIEPIKTSDLVENKSENLDLQFKSTEMDISNDEDIIEPTSTQNSEPVSDSIEVDVSQDEGTSEQVASRSKSKRTSKKFLEQSKDESELEQPSEPKTTRSKLVQKSKDVEKEIDNSTIENVPTESIVQEPIITSSRITLRRKSTRLLEPVIDNSELSDPEKAASIDNKKPVIEKETINCKDSEFKEKLNEIEVVLEKIEVIPEKTRRQSAKMDKVNEIEKLLEKTKKQSAKIETDIEIEAISEKTKKQSAKPEKVNEMEVVSEKTKKQSTKPEKENKIAVLSETIKTQNAKSEKVNEIEVVPEKTKKQSTKSEKGNRNYSRKK